MMDLGPEHRPGFETPKPPRGVSNGGAGLPLKAEARSLGMDGHPTWAPAFVLLGEVEPCPNLEALRSNGNKSLNLQDGTFPV